MRISQANWMTIVAVKRKKKTRSLLHSYFQLMSLRHLDHILKILFSPPPLLFHSLFPKLQPQICRVLNPPVHLPLVLQPHFQLQPPPLQLPQLPHNHFLGPRRCQYHKLFHLHQTNSLKSPASGQSWPTQRILDSIQNILSSAQAFLLNFPKREKLLLFSKTVQLH